MDIRTSTTIVLTHLVDVPGVRVHGYLAEIRHVTLESSSKFPWATQNAGPSTSACSPASVRELMLLKSPQLILELSHFCPKSHCLASMIVALKVLSGSIKICSELKNWKNYWNLSFTTRYFKKKVRKNPQSTHIYVSVFFLLSEVGERSLMGWCYVWR